MRLLNVTAAELDKIRTLPAAVLVVAGTTLTGAVIAAALAAQDAPGSSIAAVLPTVPIVQVGLILLGVLPAAHEHAGSQLRTTLAAVPHRGLLLTGKTVATLVAVTLTATATVGASVATASVIPQRHDAPRLEAGTEPRLILGAIAYLILIGLLAHAVAVLVRHLVPALVGVLSLVLIVSPLLDGLTEHARWLPDRAAMRLYDPTDALLTGTTGALVMLGWIIVVGGIAVVRFTSRDP